GIPSQNRMALNCVGPLDPFEVGGYVYIKNHPHISDANYLIVELIPRVGLTGDNVIVIQLPTGIPIRHYGYKFNRTISHARMIPLSLDTEEPMPIHLHGLHPGSNYGVVVDMPPGEAIQSSSDRE